MLKGIAKRVYAQRWPAWAVAISCAGLLMVMALFNEAGQHFCHPSGWFGLYLLAFTACFCLYPFLVRYSAVQKTMLAISSLFLWVVVFLLYFSFYGLQKDELLDLGLVFYFPYMFAVPIIILFIVFRRIKRHNNKRFFGVLATFHLLVIIVFILAITKYSTVNDKVYASKTIDEIKEIKNTSKVDAWMLEKITGLHFKYHTRLCLWDGWRPPLLDPVASAGFMLSTQHYDYPNLNINTLHGRILLYKELFPENAVVQSCKCSSATPVNYYSDLEKYK